MSKILIADDSADLLETMKYVLERLNYTVKILISAHNIYQEISEFQPDLLILDIYLEGEDGREICRELRKNVETEYLGVLALSASPKNLLDYKSYQADDFIEKPFEIKTLEEKIQSLLSWTFIRKKALHLSRQASLGTQKAV